MFYEHSIPDGWQIKKIGDFCQIRRGASPRPIHQFLSDNGIPWVKIADATEQRTRFIDKTNEYIIEKGRPNTVMVKPGDLIVSNSATPGIPKFMKIHAGIHDGWLLIEPSIETDKDFVYYLFINERNNLIGLANGTIFKNLKTDIVRNHQVTLPPKTEQEGISKILSVIDTNIELNQRMNRTLEAVGGALFRRWFVDFEFPNQEGKPYRSTGGKMVESELGEIPEGWMVGILGDIADKISISVSSEEKFSYDKYVSLDDMPKEQIFLNRFSSVDDVDSSMISFEEGDILFGAMRPYFHKVCIAPFSGITRTTTFVIRAKNKAYQSFLTFLCFQKSTVDYADSTSVGSTIPYAVFDALEKMPIIIPRNEVALKFQQFIKPFIDKAHANFRETLILSQIRDLLLPKLISGKIRVPLKKEN